MRMRILCRASIRISSSRCCRTSLSTEWLVCARATIDFPKISTSPKSRRNFMIPLDLAASVRMSVASWWKSAGSSAELGRRLRIRIIDCNCSVVGFSGQILKGSCRICSKMTSTPTQKMRQDSATAGVDLYGCS